MRATVAWTDKVPERDGIKSVCYDIAFRPDGTQLIAAVGSRVLMYDAVDGDLLHSLKGHKDTVYCVAYSRDGKRFASGGADKTIIIWTHKAEGILKYSHNDSIQCLSYNPVTQQLASATASDFGLWSPEQKSVAKHKVSSKVLCASWTNDGQYLALGMYSGHISIRDKQGAEQVSIERQAPVWSLQWNPSRDDMSDILAVGCWDSTLSFYKLSGTQVGKDKELGFDPCCVSFFNSGDYLCVGGTDRKVTMCTKDGTRLTGICEREDWVWCARPRPRQNFVAVGCNDGSITMYQLVFSTVHGLYQDRYAYRDLMTDVIIQHLITEQKVRIKCRDYVKKISVYKERLAVQLPDRVIIYELSEDDAFDMQYRVSTKIQKRLDCNLLVVTSQHVILCQERKLQLYAFDGNKEREWILDSVIRYIKVVGGPVGREGLLVGLKSGLILKIFVDNPFPIHLIKHSASIRCLDLNSTRSRLAVVDENTNVVVYDLQTKEVTFEEKSASSVAWNMEMEHMLCYSGNGMLSIKTGDFPVHQQKLQGFVVGFKGSKIFCLHYVCMQTIEVPQSASMHRYVAKRDYASAYKVACLGVTEADWRVLAIEALQAMELNIARQAFIRARDVRYLDLVDDIDHARRGASVSEDDSLYLARVLAYQGKYDEAAQAFAKSGHVERAMDMFSDLRMFEQAKLWAEEYGKSAGAVGAESRVMELIEKQAEWSEQVNDHEAAAEMYLKAGNYDKAMALIARHGWMDKLIQVVRGVDKSERKVLGACATTFRRTGHHQYAKETFTKMGDHRSLLELHVDLQQWEEAFTIVKQHPEYHNDVYVPYAKWLAANDRFEEARVAFKEAGHPQQSQCMLEQLAQNAVAENRFKDAAYLIWLLALEHLSHVGGTPLGHLSPDQQKHLALFHSLRSRAKIYFAYHSVYRCTDEPFRTILPETLFNAARFLFSQISSSEAPQGVSRVYVLYALAKQGEHLGAYKLARQAYDRLQGLRVPRSWQELIDIASVGIRAKPFADTEGLLPLCYRCSTSNPLLSPMGDTCVSCSQHFVRSFLTFDHLPLVEFTLEEGITHEEAMNLLNREPPVSDSRVTDRGREEREWESSNVQTLRFDEDEDEEKEADFSGLDMDDAFSRQLMVPHQAVRADRKMLLAMNRSEVVVQVWRARAIPPRYFRIMDPEMGVHVCEHCNMLFEEDECEIAFLESKACPFCRASGPPPALYPMPDLPPEPEPVLDADPVPYPSSLSRTSSRASTSEGARTTAPSPSDLTGGATASGRRSNSVSGSSPGSRPGTGTRGGAAGAGRISSSPEKGGTNLSRRDSALSSSGPATATLRRSTSGRSSDAKGGGGAKASSAPDAELERSGSGASGATLSRSTSSSSGGGGLRPPVQKAGATAMLRPPSSSGNRPPTATLSRTSSNGRR